MSLRPGYPGTASQESGGLQADPGRRSRSVTTGTVPSVTFLENDEIMTILHNKNVEEMTFL